LEGPGVWQTLGKKGRKKAGVWQTRKKNYTYILTYTYGGTYKYVRWGGGLEFSKL
jgi:hypothetical protein